jgi:tetratricopeptide (TPR) repeat protein
MLELELRSHATPALARVVVPTLESIDQQQHAIAGELSGVCEALDQGKLTQAQADTRTSCLERSAIDLEVVVDDLLGSKNATMKLVTDAQDSALALTPPAACRELDAPPIGSDRVAILALYARFQSRSRWNPDFAGDLKIYQALEADARGMGEQELAVSAAIRQGGDQLLLDRHGDADETLRRAVERAQAIHSTGLVTRGLIRRARVATSRGDTATARSLLEAAHANMESPALSTKTKLGVLLEEAHAAETRDDVDETLRIGQQGLELAAANGNPATEVLGLRFPMIVASNVELGRASRVLPLARDTVTFAREHVGETPDYGVALNLFALTLSNTGDKAGALVASRDALAVMLRTVGPDSSRTLQQRIDVASRLVELSRYQEARGDLLALRDVMERNQGLAGSRPEVLYMLAQVAVGIGNLEEGQHVLEEAIEASAGVRGLDHPRTLQYRVFRVEIELNLEHLSDADHHLSSILDALTKRGDRLALVEAHALEADLLDGRGKAGEAAQLMERDLGLAAELHAPPDVQARLHRTLADVLASQHRYADALPHARNALELVAQTQMNPAVGAEYELTLATIQRGLGHRADAIAHARHAKQVLAAYPGEVALRKKADGILR